MEEYRKYEPFFGSWYINRLIGKGSFGKVFEITREEFGTTYRAALKIITVPQDEEDIKALMSEGSDLASISEYYEAILKEIINENEIMARLKGNSNIVSYEDHMIIPHDDGIGYDILIRMELLTPLIDRMLESNLDEPEVVKLGIDICKALELCHKKNIIHRDIKPQNIFISDNGDFKLGDFGIARTMEKTTGAMSKKGTYKYMAPEVFMCERYDETVDIYSLGLVLYTLLNGNRGPFLPAAPAKVTPSDEESARLRRLRGEVIPAPGNADPVLCEIICKACAADPAERYQSAAQMRHDLEGYQNGERGRLSYLMEGTTVADVEAGAEADRIRRTNGINRTNGIKGSNGAEITDGAKSSRRKTPSGIVAAAVAALAIALVAAGILMITRSDNEPAETTSDTTSETASETTSETTADTTSDKTSETPAYLEDAAEFNGHYYKLIDDHMTWSEAKAACEAVNGHLVTITDAEEQSFISNIIESHISSNDTDVHHYWLGGTDEGSEGIWEWVTGEDWSYTNWCDNQPNDGVNDINKEGQDYLEIQLTKGDQGSAEYLTWNDINNAGTSNVNGVSHEEAPDYCSTKYFGYICEWDDETAE